MLKPRVIACLDVAGGTVVKGRQFADLVPLGAPDVLARRYEAEGADELVLLDITATREGRTADLATVERVAKSLTIPLTVGGGIATWQQAGSILAAGADKVTVNTAALDRPVLLTDMADRFGSQAVVVAVDVRREQDHWRVYAAGGARATGWTLCSWLPHAVAQGAGEVLLTSIDRDGTGMGYDVAALARAAQLVSCPIIASGGASEASQMAEALAVKGVTGVLVAGVLHRGETTVGKLKQQLRDQGVVLRV